MIDLFTAATMNGRRAALALAECSLAHRVHRLDLNKMDQREPEFLAINSRGTIPVIIDASGPGGTPITVTQSARPAPWGADLIFRDLLRKLMN
jgi:GST-like protein